jgi:hypothetical protein
MFGVDDRMSSGGFGRFVQVIIHVSSLLILMNMIFIMILVIETRYVIVIP